MFRITSINDNEILVDIKTYDPINVKKITLLYSMIEEMKIKSFLERCVNLEEFEAHYNFTMNIDFSNMRKLRVIVLTGENCISSLRDLVHLRDLDELHLSDDFDGSLEPLLELENLRKLRIGMNFNNSIDCLYNMSSLRELTIFNYDCVSYNRLPRNLELLSVRNIINVIENIPETLKLIYTRYIADYLYDRINEKELFRLPEGCILNVGCKFEC